MTPDERPEAAPTDGDHSSTAMKPGWGDVRTIRSLEAELRAARERIASLETRLESALASIASLQIEKAGVRGPTPPTEREPT